MRHENDVLDNEGTINMHVFFLVEMIIYVAIDEHVCLESASNFGQMRSGELAHVPGFEMHKRGLLMSAKMCAKSRDPSTRAQTRPGTHTRRKIRRQGNMVRGARMGCGLLGWCDW